MIAKEEIVQSLSTEDDILILERKVSLAII